MYDDVLVTTDGSSVATAACEHGLSLAEALEARVHVLFAGGVEQTPPWRRPATDWRSKGEELVGDVERKGFDRGLEVETVVRDGRPVEEILAYASRADVDAVVCGTHGRTGARRFVAGSVATAVIRDARVPVLTVNRSVTDPPDRYRDVLVATDGRPGGQRAIDHAVELASTFGSRLHALSVVDESETSLPSVIEAFENRAEAATSTVQRVADGRDVPVTSVVERGSPARQIVEYAADAPVDLVVMGTESRSGLERVAIGSCSQRVVPTAPVPVLTVRRLD